MCTKYLIVHIHEHMKTFVLSLSFIWSEFFFFCICVRRFEEKDYFFVNCLSTLYSTRVLFISLYVLYSVWKMNPNVCHRLYRRVTNKTDFCVYLLTRRKKKTEYEETLLYLRFILTFFNNLVQKEVAMMSNRHLQF